jgi:hypothetical protein
MHGEVLPYEITWDVFTRIDQEKHRNEIGITPKTEAYIQSLVLKKTFESIYFDRRRGLLYELNNIFVSKIVKTSEEEKPADFQKSKFTLI